MSQTGEPHDVVVVHWFVPLAEPIAFRVGQQWQTAQARPSHRREVVSIAARQVQRRSAILDVQETLFSAAQQALPGFTSNAGRAPAPSETATVIEIVAVFKAGVVPDDDDLSFAFDEGLDLISKVLATYSLATKDAVRPPTRESLPGMIPMASRTVRGEDQGYPGSVGVFLVSTGALRTSFMPEVSDETWRSIADVFQADDYEFAEYVGQRLDASRALDRDGDYRVSVLASATAAESLLDGLLLHMMWHEAATPEDAAKHFVDLRPGVIGRSRALLAPRIGGDWSSSGDGPVARWLRDTSQVRHRVIHGAHSPTRAEAKSSYEAVTGLEQHVIKLITSDKARGKYPLTVFGLLGRGGLERRGLFSKALQQKLDSWTGSAPPGKLFRRWKTSVGDQRAQDHAQVPPPDVTSAVVLLCRRPDGSTFWAAYDKESGFVCEIESRDAELPGAVSVRLRELLAHLDQQQPAMTVSIEVEDIHGGVASGPFVLPYQLVPNSQVMFDGRDLRR